MVKDESANLKIIKKLLLEPCKFRETDFVGKACFSQDYKKYGCLETWESALEKLNHLPPNENVFNELIIGGAKVKPYLDIEWMSEKYPHLIPEGVMLKVKENLMKIFIEEWEIDLKIGDIYTAKCHRKKSNGYKYSFHIVISSHPSIVFKNSNCALILAKKLRKLCENDFNEELIDMSVYKKTQNMRLVHHSKSGEFVPFEKENESDKDLDFIITNITPINVLIEIPEQRDHQYRTIKNIKKPDFSCDDNIAKEIMLKIQVLHPTASIERIDSGGFIQFTYSDRSEPCFISQDKTHAKIGFFAYIYNNEIRVGCHSGNCVDDENKKIIRILGSVDVNRNLTFEKVGYDNTFDIDFNFVKNCIFNGSLGISNLFEQMYLKPKRIKWINENKNGSSFFWDGKLWQEDDHAFIERLLVTTVVKVLRDFQKVFKDNNDPSVNLLSEEIESILNIAGKMITKLNDGMNINQILKFIKPLIRDTEFSKIKDIHPYMLSCKNGMIDLRTGLLRQSVPEDNITKSIEVCFDVNADSSDFDKFIKQITSNVSGEDQELYNFLKWSIGYALQGSPKHKLFFVLYGEKGFNGKSMFLNTIKEVLGYYAVSMDKSVVLDGPSKTAGSHSTEICQLENCRLGILSETKEDAAIDDGQIKMLTGITDKLSVREIYGKQKEFTPSFVPFISSNHKMRINLRDKAMYERLMLIPFSLSFIDKPDPENKWERKADNSLSEKFIRNKEGILKWLINASCYYHTNQNVNIPYVVNQAKEAYRKEMNDFADFLDRFYNTSENSSVKKTDLLLLFKAFCSENKISFISKKAEAEFDKLLESTKVGNSKCYLGIKLKEDDNEADELN